MKKLIFIIILAAAAVTGIVFAAKHFSTDTIESAIEDFEDADYIDAIVVLNRLAPSADYESLEKIYYYRCRSINRLADELEDDYSSELETSALENKGTPAYVKAAAKIEKKITKINEKIKGDLALVPARKKSRIVSGGAFYSEFIGRFRGSPYIEDLDFEELEKRRKTEPERTVESVIAFYSRYPNSAYLSQSVKMILDVMRDGTASFAGKGDDLLRMIGAYAVRFPTSPDINRIYVCQGNDVNLRDSPSTTGKLVGKIPGDTILIQLEKSMDTFQVGDVRDYWHRVTTVTGLTGWIFGKFVKPVDPSKYADAASAETEAWTINEEFSEWTDSNTLKNWSHVENARKEALTFSAEGGAKRAILNSGPAESAGIFTRHSSTRAFTITSRARLIKGDSVYLAVYSMGSGKVFSLRLKPGALEVSGRSIPRDTSLWQEYTLRSFDGRYADLLIAGELISAKIEPVDDKRFSLRGVYALFSPAGEEALCETEYIRVR